MGGSRPGEPGVATGNGMLLILRGPQPVTRHQCRHCRDMLHIKSYDYGTCTQGGLRCRRCAIVFTGCDARSLR